MDADTGKLNRPTEVGPEIDVATSACPDTTKNPLTLTASGSVKSGRSDSNRRRPAWECGRNRPQGQWQRHFASDARHGLYAGLHRTLRSRTRALGRGLAIAADSDSRRHVGALGKRDGRTQRRTKCATQRADWIGTANSIERTERGSERLAAGNRHRETGTIRRAVSQTKRRRGTGPRRRESKPRM